MNIVVEEIRIHPIKSLPGIRVHSARVLSKGLENDRRWMLVDEEGKFMTQRTLPAMSGFRLEMNGRSVKVMTRHIKQEPIEFPLQPDMTEPTLSQNCTIWDDQVLVSEPFPDLSRWFSEALGVDCRLMYFPEDHARPIDPDHRPGESSDKVYHVSLADGYPVLLANAASLEELNSRLSLPVTMDRFRPNIVLRGLTPYAEDTMRRFRVGHCSFEAVKTCPRCNLITIDPETGLSAPEPLSALSEYRKKGNKVLFGMDCVPLKEETIYEGDEITLL